MKFSNEHSLRAIIPFLIALAPTLAAAEITPAAPRKKLSAVSLLPDGSQLQGVMFPRYDENHRLVGMLKAKAMTLVNAETIAGETVFIEFFNPDESPRGHVNLTKAVFNQAKGMLESTETVIMQSERLKAMGTGLYYAFNQGTGFLIGPVITWIQTPAATPMHSNHSPLRATALAGLSLIAQPLAASPPPAVTPAELAAIQKDAAPTTAVANESMTRVKAELATDTSAADAAAKDAKAFASQAGIANTLTAQAAPIEQALHIKPGPEDTVISCDGGMYFDADAGILVYLKNVRVADPQFSLTGANELKIFLAPKPAKSPKANEPKSKTGLSGKFGQVERIVANGTIRIVQKQPEAGKEPIEASGAIFTYHTKTGQIVLSGGYPWVKQGPTFMRANQPNLSLRILKTGSFVTEGNWDMGGPLNSKGPALKSP